MSTVTLSNRAMPAKRANSTARPKEHCFTVLIQQDEDGVGYVASVPALRGCYTQADTIPELMAHIREAIELCLEVQKDIPPPAKFIGVQQMAVAAV